MVAMTALAGVASLGPAAVAHAAPANVARTSATHQSAPSGGLADSVGPGTSIGTAWPPMQGGTAYSESLSHAQDWYILYKKHDTTIATIAVANTSDTGLTCTGILVELDDVTGTRNTVEYQYLSANQEYTFTVPGAEAADPQGRYYLEVTPNCNNGQPDGQTYTVDPESAGEWANPPRVPFAKALRPGASIGTAWPPLQGGRLYSDSLTQAEDWFALYKKGNSAVGTIRVVNDTVAGSISCTQVLFELYDVTGTRNTIEYVYLDSNQAYTFTVPGTEAADPQGRYYLRVTPNCNNGQPDGQAYTVEPESAAQWANPARVPLVNANPATSLGGTWPPLAGGHVNAAALAAAANWYILYKKNTSTVAGLRVVNTTINGSISCGQILAQLYGVNGTSDEINYVYLDVNQAYTFAVPGTEAADRQGRYYLEITPNCNNGLPDGQTYTVEPEPGAQWGNDTRALPFGVSRGKARGPLAAGVNYAGSVARKGAQDWSYFVARAAVTVRVLDTATSSAGCKLVVTAGSATASLTSGQLAALHVAKAGKYYLELRPNSGCGPRSALTALLRLYGGVKF
jgi:hypothetical protein